MNSACSQSLGHAPLSALSDARLKRSAEDAMHGGWGGGYGMTQGQLKYGPHRHLSFLWGRRGRERGMCLILAATFILATDSNGETMVTASRREGLKE